MKLRKAGFDGKIFISPDEPLVERRKRMLKRFKVRAERDVKMCLLKMVFYRLVVFQCFHCKMVRFLAIDVWN